MATREGFPSGGAPPTGVPPSLRIPIPDKVPVPLVSAERKVRSMEIKQFLCGVLAGGASAFVTTPLETVRTKVIARKGAESTGQMLKQAAQSEGVRKAIMGGSLKISVLMNALGRGVNFYVYESVKKAAHRHIGYNPRTGALPPSLAFSTLAGAAGALASTLVTYPVSTVSDHMSLQPGKYQGILHALRGVAREKGLSQLYRGIVPKLLSAVPAGAVSFYTFDALKQTVEGSGKRKMTTLESLTFGALSGVAATLATYPFELIQREINMSLLPSSATPTGGFHAYNNVGQALFGIARSQGIAGLYRGVFASVLEIAPKTAISFMVYEAAKRAFVAVNEERRDEVKG